MILLKNAKIYTCANEIIENGYLLIEDGKIKEVASGNYSNQEECVVIDAEGRSVFPGFVEAHCHLGLSESGIGFEGKDHNESNDPCTPHMRAIDAINPMDITFEEARNAGVTTAAAGPGSANVFGGTFAAIKTWGNRIDNMIIKEPLAMKCAFGENPKRVYSGKGKLPSTRMGTAALMRSTLNKAKQYLAKKEAAGDDLSKMPSFDMVSESLIPVLKKEIPLKAHAHRADDIFTAIRIAKEFDLKITIDHTTEGALIVDELVKENLPCIVGPSFGHRGKFELTNKGFEAPVALSKAGLKIAITTDSPVTPIHRLPLMAGLAVREGMDKQEALKAITIYAAEILGIADRVGSLEAGKDADLSIYDGHPFETSSKAWKVFIDGQEVYSAK